MSRNREKQTPISTLRHNVFLAILLLTSPASLHAAETLFVERGVPRAEIVVAERRPRMATLAALELRHFVQKMSGARLPIVTAATAGTQLKIHVGQSAEADLLGVTAQGLRDGAYRIVSGPGWLVLIGTDRDFDSAKMPWPLSRKDVPRAAAAWAKATARKTDAAWDFPFASGFKGFWNPKDFTTQMTTRYGEDFAALWKTEPGTPAGFWLHDEGGSLNAVYGMLRRLGVRWFMPGELGEVVPKMKTIAVGSLNETVKPDYPVRDWNWYNFAAFAYDDIIWARRLGMNSCDELLGPNTGPHGLVFVLSAPAMQKTHPEYYALLGGQRDTAHRERGTPCFTSAGLEAETVRADGPQTTRWTSSNQPRFFALPVYMKQTFLATSGSPLVHTTHSRPVAPAGASLAGSAAVLVIPQKKNGIPTVATARCLVDSLVVGACGLGESAVVW